MNNKIKIEVTREDLEKIVTSPIINFNRKPETTMKDIATAIVDVIEDYRPRMTEEDMEAMAKAIEEAGGYINDHDNGTSYENSLNADVGAVVLLGKGELALWFGANSCLNACYIGKKDGLPHLSSWSNGGTIYRGRIIPRRDDIKQYNDSVVYDSIKIIAYRPIYFK